LALSWWCQPNGVDALAQGISNIFDSALGQPEATWASMQQMLTNTLRCDIIMRNAAAVTRFVDFTVLCPIRFGAQSGLYAAPKLLDC
jgi:hypothetical protein